MAEHGSENEKVEGPKRDEGTTGDGDRQDAEVPSGGSTQGGSTQGGPDPKEIAEGEATRGGYG